ncbi:MAG TPA: hypothetical protein VGA61_08760 [Anaerolineae bacterium]
MATGFAVPEKSRPGDALRDTLLVVLTFVLAMAAAWGMKSYVEQRSVRYTAAGGSLTLAYPAGWLAARADKGILLDVSDGKAGAAFHPRFSARSEPIGENVALREAAGLQSLRRSTSLREYHELSSREVTVSGNRGIEVTYAYVTDPPAGAGPATLPIVVEAADVQVLTAGKLYLFTAASEAGDAAAYAPVFARILASVQLRSTL